LIKLSDSWTVFLLTRGDGIHAQIPSPQIQARRVVAQFENLQRSAFAASSPEVPRFL